MSPPPLGLNRWSRCNVLTFSGRGILLDIEGTTSSISFVYDVMFPFVRRELDVYLRSHWGKSALAHACDAIARDAGRLSLAESPEQVKSEVLRLMDGDVKATGLKQLQGLIWEAGFTSGEMKAHVYDDVPPAITAWNQAGLDVRIYSSGSVQAQKLFFGHTIAGDLLPQFHGHYDTTTGPKKEPASYAAIAAAFALTPGGILFLSDVSAELDAAKAAGMQTGLVLRPGNAAIELGHGHPEIRSFAEIRIGG
ncbi:MAG: acireductone synthase [Pirellulaceae bacterium]|nr:acireductone synthase [Pirellulaceae bacterium]